MARQARVKDEFGIFYIRQTGGDERKLFENDNDRVYFLNILKRSQSKFQFKLYAYCLLSDNEYHLILDVNGGDLSKIMKSINIAYAMYVKCEKPLFKDRYKSQMISSNDELKNKTQMIHHNAMDSKNTSWNSFCHYNSKTPLAMNFIPVIDLKDNSSKYSCEDKTSRIGTCVDCIRTVSDAQSKLDEIAKRSGQSLSEIFKDRERRNQLIQDFRRQSTLSLKELGNLFGGLSESSVCKILNHLEEV
jgi:REP element-mobilizing transposase RayT